MSSVAKWILMQISHKYLLRQLSGKCIWLWRHRTWMMNTLISVIKGVYRLAVRERSPNKASERTHAFFFGSSNANWFTSLSRSWFYFPDETRLPFAYMAPITWKFIYLLKNYSQRGRVEWNVFAGGRNAHHFLGLRGFLNLIGNREEAERDPSNNGRCASGACLYVCIFRFIHFRMCHGVLHSDINDNDDGPRV